MAITLIALSDRVADLLTGISDTEFSAEKRAANIAGAIRRLSEDVPKYLSAEITGDGGRYYKLTGTVSQWDNDFSKIERIIWDTATLISADELPDDLEPDDWEVLQSGTDHYLLFRISTLATGTKVLVTYTAPYILSSGSYDVPANLLEAVCYLATALCCRALAAGYSQHERSSVLADSVDYAGLTNKYVALASGWEKQYRAVLGLDKESPQRPAATIIEWDTLPMWPTGGDYIFRNRRTR